MKSVAFDKKPHFSPKGHAFHAVAYKTVAYSLWPRLFKANATF